MKIYFNKMIETKKSLGIKCDAKHCSYSDTTVVWEDAELYVNAPCPKCGSNLFTEKDYNALKTLVWLEKYIGWIRLPSFSPPTSCRTHMDGSGKYKFKKLEK